MARPCSSPTMTATSPAPCASSAARSRFALGMIAILSIFLSLFLARTIVRPLRRIAIAAHRVRLGRAREVRVPRLPSRRDEIGTLARAVSDMSQSLRHRIDNIEAFAADVTHELKNPLASLRSAVDSLDRVSDPALARPTGRRHPPGRDPARPADRRHQRGRAHRCRTGARAVRAGRSRRADRQHRRRAGKRGARRAACGSPSPARAAPAPSCSANPRGWRARSKI